VSARLCCGRSENRWRVEKLSKPEKEQPVSEPQNGRAALVIGGLTAILASTCCLGPLVLVMLGFSGAWIGNLTVLEPYRPIFIGAALIALFFAYWRIFRPAQACKPGEACAIPQVRETYKIIFWIVAVLVGIALAFPYILRLFY
jgi:mercuric ion transport protein